MKTIRKRPVKPMGHVFRKREPEHLSMTRKIHGMKGRRKAMADLRRNPQ